MMDLKPVLSPILLAVKALKAKKYFKKIKFRSKMVFKIKKRT